MTAMTYYFLCLSLKHTNGLYLPWDSTDRGSTQSQHPPWWHPEGTLWYRCVVAPASWWRGRLPPRTAPLLSARTDMVFLLPLLQPLLANATLICVNLKLRHLSYSRERFFCVPVCQGLKVRVEKMQLGFHSAAYYSLETAWPGGV